MTDPLADYNSDEDEDYVPEDVPDDEDNDLNVSQGGVGGKGRKRRRGQSSVSAPVRVSLDKTKHKGKVQIGAAVISSDEEEEQESTAAAPIPPGHTSTTPVQSGDNRDNGAVEESRSVSDSNSVLKTNTASSSSASKLPFTSLSPTSSSASTTSLSGLLAQFNKKTTNTKPQVKKVIHPWELPVTTQKPQAPPTSPAAATDQATANIATNAPISSSSSSSTAPQTEHTLSTEKIQITDFTSFAGETLQVTKTVIRGSAEERAHRSTDNLTALLSSLQQKKGINTLEKSRLDWDISKQIEGDEEELKKFVSSKEGYVDKQAFLARAELRAHEKRKELKEQSKRGVASASLAGIDDD